MYTRDASPLPAVMTTACSLSNASTSRNSSPAEPAGATCCQLAPPSTVRQTVLSVPPAQATSALTADKPRNRESVPVSNRSQDGDRCVAANALVPVRTVTTRTNNEILEILMLRSLPRITQDQRPPPPSGWRGSALAPKHPLHGCLGGSPPRRRCRYPRTRLNSPPGTQ